MAEQAVRRLLATSGGTGELPGAVAGPLGAVAGLLGPVAEPLGAVAGSLLAVAGPLEAVAGLLEPGVGLLGAVAGLLGAGGVPAGAVGAPGDAPAGGPDVDAGADVVTGTVSCGCAAGVSRPHAVSSAATPAATAVHFKVCTCAPRTVVGNESPAARWLPSLTARSAAARHEGVPGTLTTARASTQQETTSRPASASEHAAGRSVWPRAADVPKASGGPLLVLARCRGRSVHHPRRRRSVRAPSRIASPCRRRALATAEEWAIQDLNL